jgi:hypothetical protein
MTSRLQSRVNSPLRQALHSVPNSTSHTVSEDFYFKSVLWKILHQADISDLVPCLKVQAYNLVLTNFVIRFISKTCLVARKEDNGIKGNSYV